MARPTIGLALGSGGARGMAHIGVLKVLRQHEIPVDYIAGSSMGSLVGALYANGIQPDMLEKLAVNLRRKHWLDFTVPVKSRLGFVHGGKIKELVRLLTKGKNIEDLPIPLHIVATDLERGEQVVFVDGPIDTAVRASIAIPGVFSPERIGNRLLVDGGVIDRVPVNAVKEMGADIVIAVDVGVRYTSRKVHHLFDVISQTIDVMEREIMRNRMLKADIVIRPQLEHVGSLAFTNVDRIIREGERAGLASLGAIREFMRKWEEIHGDNREA